MRILLCGGSGLVGRIIMNVFKNDNMDIIGTYNSKKSDELIKIDFLNMNELESNILRIKPDICISNIAERQNEICENNWNLTKKVNIDIPYNLSHICNKHNIYLIHISTDYVYDGIIPPFTPNTNTNPLQNYGISKLIAEKRIIGNYDTKNYLIIRIPVLYSENPLNLSESAVSLIIKKVMNKVDKFSEDNFSIRRPVFIEDFAKYLLDICKTKTIYEINGIHCFYNPHDCFTKYKIAELGAKILNTNINNITPINNKPVYETALRPKDTQLYDDCIHNYVLENTTTLQNGLAQCLSKFIHPDISSNQNFLLLDLDGTLVDSEIIQWKSYNDAFKQYGIHYSYDDFVNITHNGNIKEYIINNENISENQYIEIKKSKQLHMKKYESSLNLIKGVDVLIDIIVKNNINHCVVTNSSKDTTEFYRNSIPKLNGLNNWITREDYNEAKPSSECYKMAINKYYRNEKYIIGFENSFAGIKALKPVTNIIYGITTTDYICYKNMKTEDIFLINDFNDLIKPVQT